MPVRLALLALPVPLARLVTMVPRAPLAPLVLPEPTLPDGAPTHLLFAPTASAPPPAWGHSTKSQPR